MAAAVLSANQWSCATVTYRLEAKCRAVRVHSASLLNMSYETMSLWTGDVLHAWTLAIRSCLRQLRLRHQGREEFESEGQRRVSTSRREACTRS